MRPLAILFVALGLTVGGCAAPTAPGGGTLTPDDFGEPPSSFESAMSFIKGKLRDPYSAEIQPKTNAQHLQVKHSLLGPGGYGWGTCFSVNAKNAFGGYVGARDVIVIERDGRVQGHWGVAGHRP